MQLTLNVSSLLLYFQKMFGGLQQMLRRIQDFVLYIKEVHVKVI